MLPGYLDKVKSTADLFTISKIAIYPIGAGGMMTEHLAGADMAGPGEVGGIGHLGSAGDGPTTNGTSTPYAGEASERAGTVYAMEQLAASTGGTAFYNTNDLNAAMQRAIADGSHYYTIGYSPADKTMDGSFRQIEVTVDKAKLKLAYRHGYNAEDAASLNAKPGANPLSSLLTYGLPSASGVLYGVSAAPASVQPASPADRAGENAELAGSLTRYAVDFIVRAQDVTLVPSPSGGRTGQLLLGLKAYARDGSAINWTGDMETLNLTADEYDAAQKTGIPVHLELDLPAYADLALVTAVYDWSTGKAGTIEIRLRANTATADEKKP
jgi:hypothetical protein